MPRRYDTYCKYGATAAQMHYMSALRSPTSRTRVSPRTHYTPMSPLVQDNHHVTTFHMFPHYFDRRFLLDSTTLCTTGGVDAVGLHAAPSVPVAESITSTEKDQEGTGTRPEPEPDDEQGGAAATTPEAAMGPVGLASPKAADAAGTEGRNTWGTGMGPEPEKDGEQGGAAAAMPEVAMGPVGLTSPEPRVDASGAEASASVFAVSTVGQWECSRGTESIRDRFMWSRRLAMRFSRLAVQTSFPVARPFRYRVSGAPSLKSEQRFRSSEQRRIVHIYTARTAHPSSLHPTLSAREFRLVHRAHLGQNWGEPSPGLPAWRGVTSWFGLEKRARAYQRVPYIVCRVLTTYGRVSNAIRSLP